MLGQKKRLSSILTNFHFNTLGYHSLKVVPIFFTIDYQFLIGSTSKLLRSEVLSL